MIRYVVDASVAIKWFIPEIHTEAAGRLKHSTYQLHAPAFFLLELGNVLCKKIRRHELTQREGNKILEEMKNVPVLKHADQRLFPLAYGLAHQTNQSLYDCLYLALAEVIDGKVVTADRKFCAEITKGPYGQRMCWVEALPDG